jgi:hypothetical protein
MAKRQAKKAGVKDQQQDVNLEQNNKIKELEARNAELEEYLKQKELENSITDKSTQIIINYINTQWHIRGVKLSEQGEQWAKNLVKRYGYKQVYECAINCYDNTNSFDDLEKYLVHRNIRNSKQINYILKVIKNGYYLKYSDPNIVSLLNLIFNPMHDEEEIQDWYDHILSRVRIIINKHRKSEGLILIDNLLNNLLECRNG